MNPQFTKQQLHSMFTMHLCKCKRNYFKPIFIKLIHIRTYCFG